jgi:hypothetical protein
MTTRPVLPHGRTFGPAMGTFLFTGRPPWLPGASWSKVTFVWPPAFFTSAGNTKKGFVWGKKLGLGGFQELKCFITKEGLKESKGRFLSYKSPLCN